METTYGYVYSITNLKTNEQYIGAKFGDATSIDEYHGMSKSLNSDIEKYGISNFKKTILEEHVSTKDDYLNELEGYFIRSLGTHVSKGGYNIHHNGGFCCVRSEESRKLQSISISKTQTGAGNHMFGKTIKDTIRKKIAKSVCNTRNGTEYVLISEDGVVIDVYSIHAECHKLFLSTNTLSRQLNTKITIENINKNHKKTINSIGWKYIKTDNKRNSRYTNDNITLYKRIDFNKIKGINQGFIANYPNVTIKIEHFSDRVLREINTLGWALYTKEFAKEKGLI